MPKTLTDTQARSFLSLSFCHLSFHADLFIYHSLTLTIFILFRFGFEFPNLKREYTLNVSRWITGGFMLTTVLFSACIYAAAQPTEPPHSNGFYSTFHPPMAIVILVPITMLLLFSLLSICVRNCAGSSPAAEVVLPCTAGVSRGLDPCVIESFPLFIYSAVKDLKIGRETLECAVCLSEFEDDDTLRLLPKCDHVFHRDCIGAWLAFHDTCPVCRANLTPEESNETDQSTESNIELTQNNSTSEASEDRNQTVIHIYNESCINRSMGQTRNFFVGGLL